MGARAVSNETKAELSSLAVSVSPVMSEFFGPWAMIGQRADSDNIMHLVTARRGAERRSIEDGIIAIAHDILAGRKLAERKAKARKK